MATIASANVCPVVGTTNTVLPPTHPEFDINKPGQVCPVTNASTDHHNNLAKHPPVEIPSGTKPGDAKACPVMQDEVKKPEARALDDEVCPIVGTATSFLPPDHPSIAKASADDICPKTKAKVGSHEDHVSQHPPIPSGAGAAQCPVVGGQA